MISDTMTSDIAPAAPSRAQTRDEIYDEHYRTYRNFVFVVGLFVAHVAVILLILAAWIG